MPRIAQPVEFSAPQALRSAGWLAAAGLVLSGTYALTGWGLPCPWRALTGTLCPFCGTTHLGERLLHLDLTGAWQANPFMFVLLAGVGLASVLWAVEALGGPAVRPPRALRSGRLWQGAIMAAALVFWVARNLPS